MRFPCFTNKLLTIEELKFLEVDMVRQRLQKSSERSSQPQESAMAPVLTQRRSPSPHAQQDTETQTIQQHNREATVLKIQAKYGTITPQGQERLSFLQAKMADETQRKLNFGDRLHQNSLNSSGGDVSVALPERKTAPIQAKLTIGQPGDKYEQEADRVAEQFVKFLHAPTPTRSKTGNLQSLGAKRTTDLGVIQRAPASDYLPGKLKEKYKFSTKLPYLKQRGEQGTQQSEEAQPGEAQQVAAAEEVETQRVAAAEQEAYKELTELEKKLNNSFNNEDYDTLELDIELLKTVYVSNMIANFSNKIKGICSSEEVEKLTNKLTNSYNQLIEELTQKVETIKAKAQELAANALILSANPEHINEEFVEEFRRQVTEILYNWGFRSQLPDVNMKPIWLDSEVKQAVILKWNPSWGTKPLSTDLSSSMTSIEAKTSVAGVQQLNGWNKLDSTEQNILSNLLGGETNLLSKSVRSKLVQDFEEVMTQTADEQATRLRNLINDKKSLPVIVPERPATAKVKYTLKKLQDVKKFNGFLRSSNNPEADAEVWLMEFEAGNGNPIVIFAPKAPDKTRYHNHTVENLADAVSSLPEKNRSTILQIILNPVLNPDDPYWAAQYNIPNFRSSADASPQRKVVIYPQKVTKSLANRHELMGTLTHETGHIWSFLNWGQDTSKGKWLEWKKNMEADRVYLSSYAQADIQEDLAETFTAYSSTKGSPKSEEYRKIVPHRFAMLDREYR